MSPEIARAAKRTRKGTPNHPIEFRRELAKLACEPGVSVARLALDHGLNTNLLFKWRRAYQAGQLLKPFKTVIASIYYANVRMAFEPTK